MVMEVEADMERVLDHFDLLLDRDAGGDHPCGSSDRSSQGGLPEKASGAVKERIARALRLYKEEEADELGGDGALVQVWAPARDGNRRVLATRGQPFVLASQCHRLFQYRAISLTHVFPIDGAGAAGEHGLPGRVFDARAPEWTPNVQYYSSGEYARISYALIYDIQGSLALPIFDPDTRCCLAVLELVMTVPMVRFAGEVDKLCKALQAVELRGSEICHPAVEICNPEAIQLAMSEVSEILATVCEAHKLPLAQAWVTCKCRNPDTQCTVDNSSTEHFSLTTAGAPFYLTDAGVCGFREACVEHHLQRGQGIVGKAAATRRPRFCADVTKCSKDAYPLAHYARLYGLVGCLVVCLQLQSDVSMNNSQEEYVLEFFLPPDRRSVPEQKAALGAISAMIWKRFGDLKVTTISNLQDLSLVADGDQCVLRPDHVVIADTPELKDPGDDDRADSDEDDVHLAVHNVLNGDQIGDEDPRSQLGRKKMRRGKAEKSISLEELQRYFSESLKDAARSIGVCPTTMKRICRQNGISRWPFRKIKKLNRSLDKIKGVVEWVECSPKTTIASSSEPAPAPHLPCLSSALGVASSQGSCQAPRLTNTALRRPLKSSSNGAGGVVTIKASYRGDIVRFRVPCSAGVVAVKEEVAKRLGLEVGAFDVKYLDDDLEWVLLSCDEDFQECLDVVPALPSSLSAGSRAAAQVVRLTVQEVADNLGSSCGSSD